MILPGMYITGFMLSNMFAYLASGICVWAIAGHKRFFSKKYIDKDNLRWSDMYEYCKVS